MIKNKVTSDTAEHVTLKKHRNRKYTVQVEAS